MYRTLALLVTALVIVSSVPAAATQLPCIALTSMDDKIDPALRERMQTSSDGDQFAVIVEMKIARPPDQGEPGTYYNATATRDASDLFTRCGTLIGPLALIAGAAGLLSSGAIGFMSQRSDVAFIHEDKQLIPSAPVASDFPPGQLSTAYPREVRADSAWQAGVRGGGVAVAVFDSGIADDRDLRTLAGATRVIGRVSLVGTTTTIQEIGRATDPGGHGTHVAGIIAGNGASSDGQFVGIAPHAALVDVRVLDQQGRGRISSVIRGIEWTLAHRTALGVPIAVMNMSFGAPARTSYRKDPLTSAVEIAWRNGVVSVIAAGNDPSGGCATVTRGPTCTVASPGIDPFAITVGALDDRGTLLPSDDLFPRNEAAPARGRAFSAWGTPMSPTPKPDVVAPGRRIPSIRAAESTLANAPTARTVQARNGSKYLVLTGTSMATAVVSGAVALMLSHQPLLKPDQVKAILTGTVQPWGQDSKAGGLPDPAADGYGLIDANAATFSSIRTFANRGLLPAETFSRALYPVLFYSAVPVRNVDGSPVDWGNDSASVAWDSVAWDSVAWDSVAWDSVAWDSDPTWNSVAWDSVAWDSVAWDSVAWDSLD